MKLRKFYFVVLMTIALFSCNDDEYIVTLKQSGTLNVQLLKNEAPVVGETVYLLSGDSEKEMYSESYLPEIAIDYLVTNDEGIVDFGEINAGNYTVVTKGIEVNNEVYHPSKIFQISSGNNKSLSLNVLSYTGNVSLTLKDDDGFKLPGLTVYIITEETNYNYFDNEDKVDYAIKQATSDSSGKVSFKLPSGETYYAIISYKNNYDYTYYKSINLNYLSKGEEYSKEVEINI